MIYRIEITETARKELLEGYEWIRKESQERARKWLHEIHSVIQNLKDFPQRCSLAPENDLFHLEIRQLFYGKTHGIYRIIFFIKNDVVYIAHIRHGTQRPLKEWEPDRK